MSDERGTSDDSTRFTARPGADDETRFTGVGSPPTAGGKSEATFPPGSLLGHTYRIEAFLARGGMGEVYRARHAELNTEHAIKIILPELANNQRVVDLFRREASVLRNIRHDAVVAYDGVFRDENGRLYLVMEFADGPSLSKLMRERPLEADEVRQLRDRLADGLAVAHDKGVIHRDISPDNVILPGGDLGKAKIIDFGISKAVDPEVKTIIGDDFAGKLSYVSPEQLGMFGGQIDGRSDIYSLGLVLAAAAQGEPLDMGQSPIAVIEARRTVPDLSRVPAAVRADLAAMLQPDPAKRPQTMRELIRSPQQVQQGTRRSTLPDRPPPSAAKSKSAGMAVLIGALAILLAGGGGAGYWYWQSRTHSDDTGTTSQQLDNSVQQNGNGTTSTAGTTETAVAAGEAGRPSTSAATAAQTTNLAAGTTAQDAATTTQQQAAVGTESSNVATAADTGGQAAASIANNAGASSNASVATTGGEQQSQSLQQTNDSAPATTTSQTAAETSGGATPDVQSIVDQSQSDAQSAANDQSATSAVTVSAVDQPVTTTTAGGPAAASTATTANSGEAATSATDVGAAAAGTAATDTQTALLPQVPDVEMLRTQARNAVAKLACAGVLVAVSGRGDIAVSGYVASEADRDQAVAALNALPQVGSVDSAIEVRTRPLCDVLNVLHEEVAFEVGAPSALQIEPGGPYHEGLDSLNLTVTPPRDGYLYVDYIDAADEDPAKRYVLHLMPSPLRGDDNRVKAGRPVIIGSLPSEKVYVFNKPLGANMVLAILSPQPLFKKARPQQDDDVAGYLATLRSALNAAVRKGNPDSLLVGTSRLTFVTQ